MTTIIKNRTKTIATRMRSNKLSYFKCIKWYITKVAFTPAINNAAVTVNAPRWNDVISIVTKVRNMSTNKIFDSVLYSIVWVVLFAMVF
jgi:hypothetical protein